MKKITLIIIFSFFTILVMAQDAKTKARKDIYDLFNKSLDRSNFKDTNMVYIFAFNVSVYKESNRKVSIKSIDVSDSIARTLFPNFDFLKQIDYAAFMGGQKTCSFVFPIAIFLEFPTDKDAGMVNITDIWKRMPAYLYWSEQHPNTENHIYLPGLMIKTSTVADF